LALAAKDAVVSQAHHARAFEDVLDVRDLADWLFDHDDWGELQDSFGAVAAEELENWFELSAMDELDELESYASRMDVELDVVALQTARRSLAEKLDEDEERALQQIEREDAEPEPVATDESEQIEILFAQLAEE
jgi:hypothetical protein